MRKKLFQPGDFLFVVWLDAFSVDDWTHVDDSKIDPCEIHSVGICVEHNSKKLTMALNHDTFNDNMSCIMTIPSGMIKEIKAIHEKNRAVRKKRKRKIHTR
jgi:hypothetical protein